jgi:Domain of unknown function (DUF5925)/ATPase family associated with various cellular activities (AAA)
MPTASFMKGKAVSHSATYFAGAPTAPMPSQMDGRLADLLRFEVPGHDSIVMLSKARFLVGEEPFARTIKLCEGPCTLPPILSEQAIEDRAHWSDHGERRLYRGGGWTVLVTEQPYGPAEAFITARSAWLVHWIADELDEANPQPILDAETVPVVFWYQGAEGADWIRQRIDGPTWADIEPNYPRSLARQLSVLAQWETAPAHGKLLVLHGAAGTGKTTAVRALARAWEPWAHAHYVLDPEVFFRNASYMFELLTSVREAEPRTGSPAPTRLVIIEDADELIRKSAKRENGQAVSRLLNVADGMIGQGLQTLFVITTNEEVDALHPAIIRPGRCLANLEFGTFTPAEAGAWLGHAGPTEPVTLAQLYALTEDRDVLRADSPAAHAGQYL